ncbi:hypothetical protein Z517_03236 [Fonsecaea pedrosoi CBS 271.37]|uniref:Uncharacterized protein n=1 Tax=Fonsecaea pedrosoi CBS 271.37 TaxID=1442368 RepID=A0A0D2GZG6_9EURO|nr:uncharacterized protein Z517_03236 [Fonsecaea pedrosoi CBS 271.37]KIW83990.1 hypothetical protein Z517_03236 [Fonsecaea pedrosoi CBS 271.37]
MSGESSTSVKLLANAVFGRGPRQLANVKEETWVGPGRVFVVVGVVDTAVVVEAGGFVEELIELLGVRELELVLELELELIIVCEVRVEEKSSEREVDVEGGEDDADEDVESPTKLLVVDVDGWLGVEDVGESEDVVKGDDGRIEEETVDGVEEDEGDEVVTEEEETPGSEVLMLGRPALVDAELGLITVAVVVEDRV